MAQPSVTSVEPRRTPQQERSRERVEAIVEATRKLVGERGNDAVSVREIASVAGVPVASVYQYFPDKNAILRRLIVGYIDLVQAELGRVLGEAQTADELPDAVSEAIDTMVRLFRKEPAMATIWSSVQANLTLRELDWQDGRLMAEFMSAFFRQLMPQADPDEIFDALLYAAHSAPMTIRTAILAPEKDRERLIRELKTLLKLRVRSLMK